MPELPEVEIVARLLGGAAAGAEVESAQATGISTLKSFDPPLSQLTGRRVAGMRRRGKHLIVDFEGGLSLLIHLMSAGRFQLYDKRGSLRDKTSRLLVRLADGRELRLREFGTRQSSWAKLLRSEALDVEEAIATLGPEAWPEPPDFGPLLKHPRPLNSLLRDQRVIAGIGRSWADEILHRAKLSPFKRGDDLTQDEADVLRTATVDILGGALEHYEKVLKVPIPDKLPLPLTVHHHIGEPCPRCSTPIQAVHFEDHDMCYCPQCQTGGRSLKDRRLSRLLK
ncbi:MAG TPA: DNA-formamidopyrimidine glycosylase family protein [Actinomycetota bacterium]|nr:DNA-formamidopyrimidine glycosylase family protein [Actinomycetota bacterium]